MKENEQIIIRDIEKQKEDRTKCIFMFTLTLTGKEKKEFRAKLKELINTSTKSKKYDD